MKQNQAKPLLSLTGRDSTKLVPQTTARSDAVSVLDEPERAVPASYLFLVILALPLILVGMLPVWKPEDGTNLILFLSAPLFMGFGLVPIIYFVRKQASVSITFVLVCIAYLLYFGLRAYYHVLVPEVVLFPNFDPATDLLYMHYGLLWGTVGLVAMTLGYLTTSAFFKPKWILQTKLVTQIASLLDACSVPSLIIGFYVLGLIGRAYALVTNSASWIYNSPAYDLFASRPDPRIAGPISLFTEFCPLAFAAMLAYQYQRQRTSAASRGLWLVAFGMFLIELSYYAFSLFKFGLVGTLLIPWLVPVVWRKRLPKWGVLAVIFLGAVIFPVTNTARQDMRRFYSSASVTPGEEWATQFAQATQNTYSQFSLEARSFLDPTIVRFDGAESLAVAEKYLPQYGYEWGTTYLNLFSLAIPRVFRFWGSDPAFINWEQDYVGMPSYNLTVFPMPALVEAYLNFGLVGVLSVMFLIGVLYRFVDVFLFNILNALMTGLLLLIFWHLLDIESNLFIVLPAMFKTTMVFLGLCWLSHRMFLSRVQTRGQ